MKLRQRMREDDRGIGLITVMAVMAVVTALTVTAGAITVSNIDNSRRDRQALGAIATSEAGVAQAIQFLRSGNLSRLTCLEPVPSTAAPSGACLTNPAGWTSYTSPRQVRLDNVAGACSSDTDCFKVWIGTKRVYTPTCAERRMSPPQNCFGLYTVHSTGVSGNGPGARRVAVDVKVSPYSYPLGVFSEQSFSGNGNVGIHSESIFTAGCMQNRQDDSHSGSGTQFEYDSAAGRTKLDLFYDQPAAAHTVGAVSTSNNSCGSGSGGQPIHTSSACNTTFKYDQDSGGGPLTAGDGCYGAYVRSDGSRYPTSSNFTLEDLKSYGYRPRGLTDSQYDSLKAQAQAEGTYNLASGSVGSVVGGLLTAGINSPVLYWDSGPVSLSDSDFPAAFKRALDQTSGCSTASVTIVVMGSSLDYQGGNSAPYLVSAIFVPDGTIQGQGGINTIGTIFAKTIDLGGNPDFHVDQCFASNPPGATLDAQVLTFREDDGTDIN